MADERKYGGDAVQAIRTASQAQYHLSAMADRKASLLMGASFVVFSILVSQATARDSLPLAMLVLGVTAFLSALIAAIAVMPSVVGPHQAGARNLMFFGGFSDMSEEEYLAAVMEKLADQPQFLEMVARDVYQNGQVLAHKKYRLLRLAYSIFILGLIASVVALALAGLG